jgi:DUF1365 family protein
VRCASSRRLKATPDMYSCLYVGQIKHRRFAPKPHAFTYSLFMVYLDLAELDTVFKARWLWSANRFNLAWFKRSDYFGDPTIPIDLAIRDYVAEKTGILPLGPIRLLTHLRYVGYCMNPVSFYYCFDPAGRHVQALVAEVTNTPWGERHEYALDLRRKSATGSHAAAHPKQFHVSPFMPMAMEYRWQLSDPGERLHVRLSNHQHGDPVLNTGLRLSRRPLTRWQLTRAMLCYPLVSVRIFLAIYWQALRLWSKGVPFVPHPRSLAGATSPAMRQAPAVGAGREVPR